MRVIFIITVTAIGIVATFFSDAFYGVLLYAFYAFASPLDLTWGALAGSRLSFVVAAATILSAMLQRKKIFFKHIIFFLLMIFIFSCYCSLALRHDASPDDWGQLELLLRIIIMTIVMAALIDTPERLRIYILAVGAFTGILGAYYGFGGLLVGSQQIVGPGRVGDNNGYAVWLNTSLPFIYYVSLQFKKTSWRYLAKIALLGNIIAVILTFSRGGAITLLAVLGLMFINMKRKSILFFLFIPVALVAIFFLSSGRDGGETRVRLSKETVEEMPTVDRTLYRYRERIETLHQPEEEIESAVSRRHCWALAVIMANDNPVLGVGLNRYRAEYDNYDTSAGKFGRSRAVHNTLLSVLSETGYLGFSTFIFLILSCLAMTIRAKRISRSFSDSMLKIEVSDYAAMLRVSTVAFLLGSFFVNTLYQEMFWVIITIAIALDRVTQKTAIGEALEARPSIKSLSRSVFGR